MKTGHSSLHEASARRRRRAGLAILLVCVAGFACAAPQDFDLDRPCAGALPRHTFNAKAGTAFDGRIGLLNGDGKRIFWAFLSPPAAGFGELRCSEVRPGAVFRCGDVTIALPTGAPKASVPDREFTRLSGTPAMSGAINFSLIIQEDGADGASCERPYLLEIRPAVIDRQPPAAPAEFSAEVRLPSPQNIVDLRWQAAPEADGVVRYEIQRCEGELCPNFTRLASIEPGTRFTDGQKLRGDAKYRYRIRAFDAAGNAGEFSGIATVQTPAPGPPDHPH
ncbi:MAG: fibronectin type III domain-containing protein [Chromatiaceae bacterium]|nr:fibronectin type III domain-containing protein [Chromatiaceae bacterium]